MRAPPSLASLLEDGLIEAVLRPLQSGKEAQIYLVVAGGEERVAKIYKKAGERNFKNRSEYAEGRGTRNTRDQRAMKRRSSYGKSRDEEAWQSTEVEMLHRLRHAGVRVPVPYSFSDGVLIMELVGGADGVPAPRLGDLHFGAEEALHIHDALLRDVVRMLCAGVVHGDLSEFNVLVDSGGPVIIDLPQAVDASSNANARKLLLRDVENLQRFVTRWVPGRERRAYGAEMWALYELNELQPDTELTGVFKGPEGRADTDAVLDLISDAEEDETQRRLGRGQRALGSRSTRPRVVVNNSPPPRRRKKRTKASPSAPAGVAGAALPSKAVSLNELIARAMAPSAKAAEPARHDAPAESRRERRPSGEPSRSRRDRPSRGAPAKSGRDAKSGRQAKSDRHAKSGGGAESDRGARKRDAPAEPSRHGTRRDAPAEPGRERTQRSATTRSEREEAPRSTRPQTESEGPRKRRRRRRRRPGESPPPRRQGS